MTKAKDTVYLHAGKGDFADNFTTHFPGASEEAIGTAWRIGYEVTFTGYWTEDGEYWATHLEGVELRDPVRL